MAGLSRCPIIFATDQGISHNPDHVIDVREHSYASAAKLAIDNFSKYTTQPLLYIINEDIVESSVGKKVFRNADPLDVHSCFVFASKDTFKQLTNEFKVPKDPGDKENPDYELECYKFFLQKSGCS